jgi:hypothetical protein
MVKPHTAQVPAKKRVLPPTITAATVDTETAGGIDAWPLVILNFGACTRGLLPLGGLDLAIHAAAS